ncbi:hypothetical protein CHELA41_20391 [Hyphomicrobiales bacterium]|nr:hypothetical protein CHELA41_20391 [Hyphomicrobiales bacterium]
MSFSAWAGSMDAKNAAAVMARMGRFRAGLPDVEPANVMIGSPLTLALWIASPEKVSCNRLRVKRRSSIAGTKTDQETATGPVVPRTTRWDSST